MVLKAKKNKSDHLVFEVDTSFMSVSNGQGEYYILNDEIKKR